MFKNFSTLTLSNFLGLKCGDCCVHGKVSKCSSVSPSFMPSMIRSLMFFVVHSSEHKLQVSGSHQSSHLVVHSLQCSIDSFDVALNGCYSCIYVHHLSEAISQEKHNVSACTLVAAGSSVSPDRLTYDAHWVFHAPKSVPLST